MRQSSNSMLFSLFAFCYFVKILPLILMQAGMSITADSVYPWTFTPFFAVGLFGVSVMRDPKKAFALALTAWFAADITIGALVAMKYGVSEGMAAAFYPGQTVNYVAFLLACGVGFLPRFRRNAGTVLVAAILSPTLFFLVSNFGVWMFDTYIGYPKTLLGLQTAYIAAIPFYKNALISTLGYSFLLFSPWGMAMLAPKTESAYVGATSQA